MLGLLMMLSAAAAPAAGPAGTCAPPRLAACRDTNELVMAPAFTAAVRRFIGKRKASYLYANGDVADQQIEVLHGPPDEPTRIGELYRFTACRAHSCPEKGATVLDPSGKIVALAILYTPCATTDARDCNRRDDLVVFMRERDRLQRVEVVANLRAWAVEQVAGSYTVPGQPKVPFGGMQVIDPIAAQ
ncbi:MULTISPECIES: hypothetical protein [unclassified Sphingomonas]|uniref:hypothetical protein n=1 Tax=unclassified Sphingomonas TaxID=196159 RepID=UPI0006F3DFE7|nr:MULTISPECIES: hypothetical protein [unclassified Sphingomonas]KQS49330.1 hypothetical protein ASG20_09940 [Sphingomonas sp. Leaf198]